MFYILEIYRRVLYIFFCFFFSFIFFYFSKELFIIFLFANTFYKTFLFIPKNIEKSFLINLPETLFSLEVTICVLLAFFVTMPVLLSTLRFFFLSGATRLEYNFFYYNMSLFIMHLYLLNYVLFIRFALFFWYFSESFNEYLISNNYLVIEYEPELSAYFLFIYSVLKFFNVVYIFFFTFFFIFKKYFFNIFLKNLKIFKVLLIILGLYFLFLLQLNILLFFLVGFFAYILTTYFFNTLRLIVLFKYFN